MSLRTVLEMARPPSNFMAAAPPSWKKRHVCYNQRPVRASGNRRRVVNDGIQSYRNGRVQAQDHVTQGVAHQQKVNACAIEKPGHGRIIGGQHDDPLASSLHQGEIGHAERLWVSPSLVAQIPLRSITITASSSGKYSTEPNSTRRARAKVRSRSSRTPKETNPRPATTAAVA